MELRLKPDYEESKRRYDAFWECAIIDRPPVSIVLPKEQMKPIPTKSYASEKDRWLDVAFRAETAALSLENCEFIADALPIAWPNMGPEIFSAWCGCEYKYGQSTTWTEPCIEDWAADMDKAKFDEDHPLFRKTVEFTELLLERGRGSFIVGLTDLHPGGDHLAALRDPERLAVDMIENVGFVKQKLAESYHEYYRAYDIFYHILRDADMPITSWTPLIHDGRYYIPSNDFSCMISTDMFVDVFLDGLIEECQFYERSIYHLDGPGALRHLDTLLDISELDAVQWVCGAGNEGYAQWVDVYQRVQRAGKGIQLGVTLEELPLVFETLRPEGVWFSHIGGIDSQDTAEKVLHRIERWE